MHLTHCLVCGLWVSALLVQVALAGQTDDEECTTGCKAMNKPVCGADGITYLNKCLAKCQGVKVAFKGACTADAGPAILAALEDAQAASAMPPGLMDATSIGRVADAAATVALGFAKRDVRVITKQDMERFAAEDLVLVGVLKLDDDFKPVTPRLPPNFKSVK